MSYAPEPLAFEGDNVVQQGADWSRTLTAKVSGVAENLSGYSNTAPKCQFKVRTATGTYSATGCPVPVCAWVNATAGQYSITVPNASSSAASQYEGVFDIEIIHNSGTPKERIAEGTWKMTREVTTI